MSREPWSTATSILHSIQSINNPEFQCSEVQLVSNTLNKLVTLNSKIDQSEKPLRVELVSLMKERNMCLRKLRQLEKIRSLWETYRKDGLSDAELSLIDGFLDSLNEVLYAQDIPSESHDD